MLYSGKYCFFALLIPNNKKQRSNLDKTKDDL